MSSAPGSGDQLVVRVAEDSGLYSVEDRARAPGQHEAAPASSSLTTALVVAVVVGGLLLALALLIFVVSLSTAVGWEFLQYLSRYLQVVRRRAGRGAGLGRARSDTLALSPHQASTASAGVTASYSQDTEDILASERDLASLKARIWMIPKNFLELSGEVLGQGRWGSVVAGQVQNSLCV